MQSKVNKLLATTTMLVAMGLFAAMSPAWAQNTGQQNQTPQQQQQQQQPNAQQQQPSQQGQQPSAQPGQNAEPSQPGQENQETPAQQQQENQQGQQQGMANGEITATGCLQSAGGGQYSLTDQATNQTYTLTSSTEDLSKHVGQDVKITGTPSNAGAAGTPAGEAGQQQTVNVTKVKKVSSSCSGGGATGQPPSIL